MSEISFISSRGSREIHTVRGRKFLHPSETFTKFIEEKRILSVDFSPRLFSLEIIESFKGSIYDYLTGEDVTQSLMSPIGIFDEKIKHWIFGGDIGKRYLIQIDVVTSRGVGLSEILSMRVL